MSAGRRCIYCGAECYGRACRAHSDLHRLDIWEGWQAESAAMSSIPVAGVNGTQGEPAARAAEPVMKQASSKRIGRAHLHSSGVPSSRGRVS